MAMISALWTRRSISETTQGALGKTSCYSANGRLVVISCSYLVRLTARFTSGGRIHRGSCW
jgi:hypothetical protein